MLLLAIYSKLKHSLLEEEGEPIRLRNLQGSENSHMKFNKLRSHKLIEAVDNCLGKKDSSLGLPAS